MKDSIQAGARVRFIKPYPYPGGEIPRNTEARVAYVIRANLFRKREVSLYVDKRRLHGIDVDYLTVV